MAMYRIIDGGTVYSLDGVMEGSFTFRGKATRKPIQDGSQVSDHYVLEPTGITFSGKITDVKRLSKGSNFNSSGSEVSVLDTVTEWQSLQKSGRPFTMEVGPSSGTTFTNCVFDEIQFSNDSKTGNFWEEFFAFNVRATVSQLKFSKRARIVVEPDRDALGQSTGEKTTGSGANVTPTDEEYKRGLEVKEAAIIRELDTLDSGGF